MKIIKNMFALVLAVALAFSSIITVYAEDNTFGDYTYTVNEDGVSATITSYTGTDTDVVIPDEVGGYTVTAIGAKVFYNNSTIVSVTVPLAVATIEDNNFFSCSNLEEVKGVENLVTIGEHCFGYSKKLTNLPEMNCLESVGAYSFNDCESMTRFHIPKTTSSISYYSFIKNNIMLSMDDDNPYFTCIDGVVYNKNVSKVIKCSCPKTEYTFPDTVTTIGSHAFWYCKLEKINGGANVTTVESYAFAFCSSLESIESLSGLEAVKDYAFEFAVTGALDLPKTLKNLSTYAFSGCYMNKLIIHNNLSTIPSWSFSDCAYLTDLVIEEGVEKIGDKAFQGCNRLKKVQFPESLISVGNYAFACSLTEVYIPSGVTSIGKYAFGYGYNRLNWTYPVKEGYRIFGHTGTAAQTYAESNSISFYDVDTLFSIDALGNSIRVSNPGGLRFGFRINEAILSIESFDNAELGFIYRYGNDSSDLFLENVGANGVKKKIADNKTVSNGFSDFNLVFVNIPEQAYDSNVSVRAYAIVNGFVYYSEPITANARDIARAVCADLEDNSDLKNKIKEIYKI